MNLKVKSESRLEKSTFAFYFVFFLISGSVFLLDFITKKMAVAGVWGLKPVYNHGSSFSIGNVDYMSIVYSAFSIIAIICLFILLARIRSLVYLKTTFKRNQKSYLLDSLIFFKSSKRTVVYYLISIGCLVGAILGNVVDRATNPPYYFRGYVVDFINYFGFVTGNVADIFIVASVMVFLVLFVRNLFVEKN